VNEKLSLIASVSVIALASYGAWLLADVDKAKIVSLNDTVSRLVDTLGGSSAPVKDDKTKPMLYAGIAVLLLASTYVLLKK